MLWQTARTAALISVLWCTSLGGGAALADKRALQEIHGGVAFIAIQAPPGTEFDIPIVAAPEALQHLKDAHDLLFAKSAAAAAAIDRLKQAGDVLIVFDPHFPARTLSSRTIAAFFPDYLKDRSPDHTSLVVVGRYGINWPVGELGVVLAHELLGHGIQHLEGRLWRMRNLDMECEAFLWTEQATQDLGLNKEARSVISLRREIERHWCAGFIAWSAANQPAVAALWETRNPDVPALIDGFRSYAAHLEASGQTARATDADAVRRGQTDGAARAADAASGDPERQYAAALAYKLDRTRPGNFETALMLLQKAAEGGHREAQFTLGFALLRELPGGPDMEGARRWLAAAAAQGHERAKSVLRLIPGG